MYIVVRGRLEVHVGEHVRGATRPGRHGRLALLTGQPRSTSLRARRDSRSWSWTRTASTKWRSSSRKFPWPWLGRWLGACSGWKLPRSKPAQLGCWPSDQGAEARCRWPAAAASLVSTLGVHLSMTPVASMPKGWSRPRQLDPVVLTASDEDLEWRALRPRRRPGHRR